MYISVCVLLHVWTFFRRNTKSAAIHIWIYIYIYQGYVRFYLVWSKKCDKTWSMRPQVACSPRIFHSFGVCMHALPWLQDKQYSAAWSPFHCLLPTEESQIFHHTEEASRCTLNYVVSFYFCDQLGRMDHVCIHLCIFVCMQAGRQAGKAKILYHKLKVIKQRSTSRLLKS